MYLNVYKKALEIVFHLPLQIEKKKYKGQVLAVMQRVREAVNARMAQEFSEKRFGGDGVFS
eukprot:3439907-Prymnesium_polylepis.1